MGHVTEFRLDTISLKWAAVIDDPTDGDPGTLTPIADIALLTSSY